MSADEKTPARPRRSLRRGALLVFATGCLYALRALALGWAGAVPLAPSPLRLAPYNFFFWEMIFSLPLIVAAWLIVSLWAKLLGRVLGGKGSFRETAAALAAAFSAPLLFVWVFEAAVTVLRIAGLGQQEFADIVSTPGFWQTLFLGYLGLGALLLWLLTVRALAKGQKLGRIKALLAGTLTAAIYLLVLAVFVR